MSINQQAKQKKRKSSKIHQYTPVLQQQHGQVIPGNEIDFYPPPPHHPLDQPQMPMWPGHQIPVPSNIGDHNNSRKRFHASKSSTKSSSKAYSKNKPQQQFNSQQYSMSAQSKQQKKLVYRVKDQKNVGHNNQSQNVKQEFQAPSKQQAIMDYEMCQQPPMMLNPQMQQFNHPQSRPLRPNNFAQQNMLMHQQQQDRQNQQLMQPIPFFGIPGHPHHEHELMMQNFMQQQTQKEQQFKNCTPFRKHNGIKSDFQFSGTKQNAYQPLRSNKNHQMSKNQDYEERNRANSEKNIDQTTPPSLKSTQVRASSEAGFQEVDNDLNIQKFKSQQDGQSSQQMPLRIKHQNTAPFFKQQNEIFEYNDDDKEHQQQQNWLDCDSLPFNDNTSLSNLQVNDSFSPELKKQKARTAEKSKPQFEQLLGNIQVNPVINQNQMIDQFYGGQQNSIKPVELSLNSSSMLTSFSQSMSQSHEISANCLRKCATWQLQLHDQQTKGVSTSPLKQIKKVSLEQASGIALRQMNYVKFEQNISKDEINNRKMMSKIPSSPIAFQRDIIDEMMEYEDTLIFNQTVENFHDKNCKHDHECCQVKVKKFNKYVRSAYEDQKIELPFSLAKQSASQKPLSNSSQNGYSTDEVDIMSQISSQLSEQSRTSFIPQAFDQQQVLIPNSQYNDLPLRDQMCQIGSVNQAENMFCLEFDLRGLQIHGNLDDETIQANRKFRVINQGMIESMMHLKLRGNCHGHSLFFPAEISLNFNISGKKIIKSIQQRILNLKYNLAQAASQMAQPRTQMQMPAHVRQNQEKLQKFYLNSIEKNNALGLGPYVTKTKSSIMIKLLNYGGRSIGFQIAMPNLENLPNLMSNFNQLVLQELEIEKIFICFDMPLSRINKLQACNIDDLDNYLIAKSIQPPQQVQTQQNSLLQKSVQQLFNQNQMINSPQIMLSQPIQQAQQLDVDAQGFTPEESKQRQQNQQSSKSGSTPLNLLNEFQQFADPQQNIGGFNTVDKQISSAKNLQAQNQPNFGFNDIIQTGINQCVLPAPPAMNGNMIGGPNQAFMEHNEMMAAIHGQQQVPFMPGMQIGQEQLHQFNNHFQIDRVLKSQQEQATHQHIQQQQQSQQPLLFNQDIQGQPHPQLALHQANQPFVPHHHFIPPQGQFIPQLGPQYNFVPMQPNSGSAPHMNNQSNSQPNIQQDLLKVPTNKTQKHAHGAKSTGSSSSRLQKDSQRNNRPNLPHYDVRQYFGQSVKTNLPARLQQQQQQPVFSPVQDHEQQREYYQQQFEMLQQNQFNGQQHFALAQPQIVGEIPGQAMLQQPMIGMMPPMMQVSAPQLPHHIPNFEESKSNHKSEVSENGSNFASPAKSISSNIKPEATLNQDTAITIPGSLYNLTDFMRDDRNTMCNLERFLHASIPDKLNIETNTLLDLFRSYHQSSIRGITIEMMDEKITSAAGRNRHLFTFFPTLSSLYLVPNPQSSNSTLSATSGDMSSNSTTLRKPKVIEFHEELLHYKRKPLSINMLELCKDLILPSNPQFNTQKVLEELLIRSNIKKKNQFSPSSLSSLDDSSSSSYEGLDEDQSSEQSDTEEILQSLESNQPSINELINTECSFFAILWQCQQQLPTVSKDVPQQQSQQTQQQRDAGQNQPQNMQFLVLYKFSKKKNLNDKTPNSDLQIIGLLPYKMEREQFWLTPGRMQSENEMQGQLFDEIYDSQMDRLFDLQQRAINYMREEGMLQCSNDFQFFQKSLQNEHIIGQLPVSQAMQDNRFNHQFVNTAEQFIQQMAAMQQERQQQQKLDAMVFNKQQ